MEDNKIYTSKELSELMKKLKKSTRKLVFQTTLYKLFADIHKNDLNGKKVEDFADDIENPSILYEGLLEDFAEHEKVVAELKEALTSFHLVDNEDVTKE